MAELVVRGARALQAWVPAKRSAGIADSLAALALPGIGLEQLSAAHRRLFGHPARGEVPAYETEYGSEALFQQPQELSDLAGFMAAFGLTLRKDVHERVDHVSCECEFLSFLGFKEAYAIEAGDAAMLDATRRAQALSLRDHLGRFAAAFARRLERADRGGFYGGLAKVLQTLVARDCERDEGGAADEAMRRQTHADFVTALPMLGAATDDAFHRFFDVESRTHAELMSFCINPRVCEEGEGLRSGGRCPICRFPTFEPHTGAVTAEMACEIRSDFPAWRVTQGLCRQCGDLYDSRRLGRRAATDLNEESGPRLIQPHAERCATASRAKRAVHTVDFLIRRRLIRSGIGWESPPDPVVPTPQEEP